MTASNIFFPLLQTRQEKISPHKEKHKLSFHTVKTGTTHSFSGAGQLRRALDLFAWMVSANHSFLPNYSDVHEWWHSLTDIREVCTDYSWCVYPPFAWPWVATLDTHWFRNCEQGWPFILLCALCSITGHAGRGWCSANTCSLGLTSEKQPPTTHTLGDPHHLTWSLCLWVS